MNGCLWSRGISPKPVCLLMDKCTHRAGYLEGIGARKQLRRSCDELDFLARTVDKAERDGVRRRGL